MRLASMGRAGAFLLALALAGVGAERTAAACAGTSVACPDDKPICVGGNILDPTAGTCAACSTSDLTRLCTIGTTCQTSGACTNNCSVDYDAAAASNSCTEVNPACAGGTCKQCVANTPNDKHCPSTTPDCNGNSLCGCTGNFDCPTGTQCNVPAGVYGVGECQTRCSSDNGCTTLSRKFCVVDGGDDLDGSADGVCVACLPGTGCDFGYACDPTTYTCEAVAVVDAGSDAGSGEGDSGPVSGNDAGSVTDGGSSSRDATVGDDGGGDETSDIYRPGTAEGGGCSVLASGSGTGRGAPVFFGFAGLAGLLFLRRSQRRSDRKRNARR